MNNCGITCQLLLGPLSEGVLGVSLTSAASFNFLVRLAWHLGSSVKLPHPCLAGPI